MFQITKFTLSDRIYPIECTYMRIEDLLRPRQILRAVKVRAILLGKEPCSFVELYVETKQPLTFSIMLEVLRDDRNWMCWKLGNVKGRLVSTVERMLVPNGTGPNIPRSKLKRSLSLGTYMQSPSQITPKQNRESTEGCLKSIVRKKSSGTGLVSIRRTYASS